MKNFEWSLRRQRFRRGIGFLVVVFHDEFDIEPVARVIRYYGANATRNKSPRT